MRNGLLYDTHTAVTSTYHHGPSSHTGTIAYTYELSKGVRRRKHSPALGILAPSQDSKAFLDGREKSELKRDGTKRMYNCSRGWCCMAPSPVNLFCKSLGGSGTWRTMKVGEAWTWNIVEHSNYSKTPMLGPELGSLFFFFGALCLVKE